MASQLVKQLSPRQNISVQVPALFHASVLSGCQCFQSDKSIPTHSMQRRENVDQEVKVTLQKRNTLEKKQDSMQKGTAYSYEKKNENKKDLTHFEPRRFPTYLNEQT